MTTVCACEKTVVMVKQPGHLTSMKKDRGAGTRFYREQKLTSALGPMYKAWELAIEAYLELVLASLSGWGWVEEINCKNLSRQHHVSV